MRDIEEPVVVVFVAVHIGGEVAVVDPHILGILDGDGATTLEMARFRMMTFFFPFTVRIKEYLDEGSKFTGTRVLSNYAFVGANLYVSC